MIDLKFVVEHLHHRLIAMNAVALEGRPVSSITIMDNLSVHQWLCGGEMVLVGSQTLPTQNDQLRKLLTELEQNHACCLIVKYINDSFELSPNLIKFSEEIGLPIFRLPKQTMYLEITNDVNALLFRERQDKHLEMLDLTHLLKTDNPHEQDFDYLSSLKNIDLYKHDVQVIQIIFQDAPLTPRQRVQDLYSLTGQLNTIFITAVRQTTLSAYFVIETATGAMAILFTAPQQRKNELNIIQPYYHLLAQIQATNTDLYFGVSDIQPACQIQTANQEASFSIKMAKLFKPQKKLVLFHDVALWSLINNAQQSTSAQLIPMRLKETLQNSELFTTLKVFFQNNESIKNTSRILCTHPNTIRYRLNEIMLKTGLDYRKTDDKFCLYVAVIIKMLNQ
ncbi:PucR family transcriptional regulator [Bifidobacterium sp. ESL0732]|uniref:PucR family transcriptional regulator n=1 Tax=Bifidobacterium sp. ESL0732 TaxID=2983222 RepID=UPI0023F81B4C|nr:PucR family transcriptional regulator [Bifidobacterium sp. ESL0732]WEV64798.1 PucR family transcriptional regulator ligand-binding domain-containing protein [Bifidobacterium sp. ESL0732]